MLISSVFEASVLLLNHDNEAVIVELVTTSRSVSSAWQGSSPRYEPWKDSATQHVLSTQYFMSFLHTKPEYGRK